MFSIFLIDKMLFIGRCPSSGGNNPRCWHRSNIALQDLLSAQCAVLMSLIATFTGDTLQDNITSIARNIQQLGNNILESSTYIFQGGNAIMSCNRY